MPAVKSAAATTATGVYSSQTCYGKMGRTQRNWQCGGKQDGNAWKVTTSCHSTRGWGNTEAMIAVKVNAQGKVDMTEQEMLHHDAWWTIHSQTIVQALQTAATGIYSPTEIYNELLKDTTRENYAEKPKDD